jgi:hypothetical protein
MSRTPGGRPRAVPPKPEAQAQAVQTASAPTENPAVAKADVPPVSVGPPGGSDHPQQAPAGQTMSRTDDQPAGASPQEKSPQTEQSSAVPAPSSANSAAPPVPEPSAAPDAQTAQVSAQAPSVEKSLPKFPPPPIDLNPIVEKRINFFAQAIRERFSLYLERSGRYLSLMKEILRERDMPEDLVYLALIESGFSPYAFSRARASGPWQFIMPTARRYGLEINWGRRGASNRRSPRLLPQDLYEMFEWPLAWPLQRGRGSHARRPADTDGRFLEDPARHLRVGAELRPELHGGRIDHRTRPTRLRRNRLSRPLRLRPRPSRSGGPARDRRGGRYDGEEIRGSTRAQEVVHASRSYDVRIPKGTRRQPPKIRADRVEEHTVRGRRSNDRRKYRLGRKPPEAINGLFEGRPR